MQPRQTNQIRASIKSFQEIIQDKVMAITNCDHSLDFLGMVLRELYFNPINNRNPFAPPTDPGPSPINIIDKAAQITEVVRL